MLLLLCRDIVTGKQVLAVEMQYPNEYELKAPDVVQGHRDWKAAAAAVQV